MSLTNEKIARWIENRFANDYFRFDLICSPVEIIKFKQVGNVLEVNYEFWDDGHAYETQQDVLFDIEIGKEYGVNFPARMQLVTFKDRYTWTSADECLSLSENFIEDTLETDIDYIEWGDTRIEDWLDHYFSMMDKESMKAMLLEKYDAANGLPEFIPERLREPFKAVIEQSL
jgi:hypothetical protein